MKKICLYVFSAFFFLTAGLSQADWPLFRGNPLQTGTTKSALPDKLEVLWKLTFKDDIESTAAIVGDTVYVGCLDEHLYALDVATGKQKWAYHAADAIKAPVSVMGGAVFVGDDSGMVHCVDAVTGQKKWTFQTKGEISGGANFDGDRVLIGSHDSTLYCLSAKDGSVQWKFTTKGPVNGSALVAGKLTFVAGCDGDVHFVDLATGKEQAAVGLQGGQAAATAAVLGDKLYVGTMTNDFHEVDLVKKAITWTYTPAKNAREFYSSAAVTDELVLVGSRDRLLHALDRKTGAPVWTYATKNRIDSSPVVAGSRLYFGSSDGALYVLDLKGTLVQRIELGRSILASPAVSQGRLVIGTIDRHLYCLGEKK